jgi:hypothetical protein
LETASASRALGRTPDADLLAERLLGGRPEDFPSDDEIRAVLHDPVAGERLLARLREAGVSELGPSPPLDPANCYR